MSAARFHLLQVLINGYQLNPDQLIPDTPGGYNIELDGQVLRLTSHESQQVHACLFPADKEPKEAKSIGLSSLSLLRLTSKTETSKYLIIKRSMSLSTFPGKMATPGGFVDADDKSLIRTAMRELEEETGCGWLQHVNITQAQPHAILDSVPTPSRHNVTVIIKFNGEVKDGISFEQLRQEMVLQDGEVDDAFFLTLDEIKTRLDEFTPGLAKLFGSLSQESERVMWSD